MQLNILLRGASNCEILIDSEAIHDLVAKLQYILGFDGVINKINLIGNSQFNLDDQGNATQWGATGLLPSPGTVGTWAVPINGDWRQGFSNGWPETSMLAHLKNLPQDVRQSPTIVLWVQDESDGYTPWTTSEEWEAAVRYEATQVRSVLGDQTASTIKYGFVQVIPVDFARDESMQAIKVGMSDLAADSSFGGFIAAQAGDMDMNNPWNGFAPGFVFYGSQHMSDADVATLKGRLINSLLPQFGQYAVSGSLWSLGFRTDALGPEIASATLLSNGIQVIVGVKLDPVSTSLIALQSQSAAGLGWVVMADHINYQPDLVTLLSNNDILLNFKNPIPLDAPARLYYNYGSGRLAVGAHDHTGPNWPGVGPGNPGQGNSIYDNMAMPIWAQPRGVPLTHEILPLAPKITGTMTNQITCAEATVTPFSEVTIDDDNSGATDTLTITVGGANGTLTGAGTVDGTVYTLIGTAAAITARLNLVTFTPKAVAPSSSSTTTFVLSVTSSAFDTPTTDATTTVIDRNLPAITISAPTLRSHLLTLEPKLTGMVDLSDAGRTVTIHNGDVMLGTTIAAADGSWSSHLNLPSNGSYTLTASVINAAGDTGISTATFVVDFEDNANLFGAVTQDMMSTAGDIYALYQTIMGRAPDPLGLEVWVAAEQNGTPLTSIAQDLLASIEYQVGHDVATQSNDAFISDLYLGGLHRQAEPTGLAEWNQALAKGVSRPEIAADIAVSLESRASLVSTFEAGVFVPNATDASIARLYHGLLGRAPDADGLQGWAAAVRQGETITEIAQEFLRSTEYVAGHAELSNAEFVNGLYQGALGHSATNDPSAQSWINMLNSSTSRALVGVGISQSNEALVHLSPAIESGFYLV